MSKTLLLSEVSHDNLTEVEDVIIDDYELTQAIINYQRGKLMEKEAEKLLEESKKVFNEKLYARKVKSATTNSVKISYTEYETKRFDTTRFKNENPNLYEMFITKNVSTRYKIDPIIDIEIIEKKKNMIVYEAPSS